MYSIRIAALWLMAQENINFMGIAAITSALTDAEVEAINRGDLLSHVAITDKKRTEELNLKLVAATYNGSNIHVPISQIVYAEKIAA